MREDVINWLHIWSFELMDVALHISRSSIKDAPVESTNTTSMEDVSTGVHEKIKNI